MKYTKAYDPFFEKLPTLSTHQRIALLERRKSSILNEMKILAERMNVFIKAGAVSKTVEASEQESEEYRGFPVIEGSESRRLLARDPEVQKRVLHTFQRFSTAKEIFGSSILPELKVLETKLKEQTK